MALLSLDQTILQAWVTHSVDKWSTLQYTTFVLIIRALLHKKDFLFVCLFLLPDSIIVIFCIQQKYWDENTEVQVKEVNILLKQLNTE